MSILKASDSSKMVALICILARVLSGVFLHGLGGEVAPQSSANEWRGQLYLQ